jgi:uncharacterized protein YndB with AHSA1/START domain
MTAGTKNPTTIEADPNLPTIKIVREFDAPIDRVHRAWTDPELVPQWLGPHGTHIELLTWDVRTGGSYRYSATDCDGNVVYFYGSFHEIRPDRLVQTFTFEGYPDGVSLDTLTLEELDGGRTRATILSLVENLQTRDMILASGMDKGVTEGYEKLDALLS